jgi:2',3'-cyclic-nucleotide 2'-phosphodiesterase (5'-nucleotidase family)
MLLSFLVALACAAPLVKRFKLKVLSSNDIHAHIDEFNEGGTPCKEEDKLGNKCFGGMARFKTMIDYFRAESEDVILLDAGDQLQGTMFFTYYEAGPSARNAN